MFDTHVPCTFILISSTVVSYYGVDYQQIIFVILCFWWWFCKPDDTEACPVYVKLATSKCLLHLHWLNIGKLVSQSLYSLYTISMQSVQVNLSHVSSKCFDVDDEDNDDEIAHAVVFTFADMSLFRSICQFWSDDVPPSSCLHSAHCTCRVITFMVTMWLHLLTKWHIGNNVSYYCPHPLS